MKLHLYNSITGSKELFVPITSGHVGMYVCGPTLYSNVHIGNLRTFLSFDVLYRYLLYTGYKVRYVRNITDVGHLEGNVDKIAQKAKLQQLQPMEVVQKYAVDFRNISQIFNLLPVSIEPTATGHIVEQIEAVKTLVEKGYAYVSNQSVYFDVAKYAASNMEYGKLSGQILSDLTTHRAIKSVDDKLSSSDFALWKKAAPEHIMQWDSPWGKGFPGWHLECTCMSNKYLGDQFDIHGGGMDLKFPHHEAEISQAIALTGKQPARYWMHTNMLTLNGEKMSKSANNSILPNELFSGENALLDQAYSPMVVRLFMLQAKYRSTLDITIPGLQAAKKAHTRLLNSMRVLSSLSYKEGIIRPEIQQQISKLKANVIESMDDDLNTAEALANIFELLKISNDFYSSKTDIGSVTKSEVDELQGFVNNFVTEVLGLQSGDNTLNMIADTLLVDYKKFKQLRDYTNVDKLRGYFDNIGLVVRDTKTESNWMYKE